MKQVRHGRSWGLVAALVAAATLGFTGCSDDDDGGSATPPPPPPPATATATTPTAPAGTTFAIEATADGQTKALTFPESVPAGLVTITLTNSDTVPRSAQFIRIDGEQTVDDVLEVTNSAEENAPIPDFIQDGGGVGATAPGQTATVEQVLVPGRYAITDDEGGDEGGPTNAELGAKGEFTVTGDPGAAELPEVAARVTATDDGEDEYGFEFEGLAAGENRVRFENTGQQLHHLILFPIMGEATLEQVEAFLSTDSAPSGPPPLDFENGQSTAVIDGDIAQNITLNLDTGRYAALCFIPDREGSPPHVAQGMIDELNVE